MTHPLEIQELREFEGGHLGWYSKGHHEATDFLTEASFEASTILDIDVRFVRQEYWRCVPAGRGLRGVCTVTARPGTRGAFPVTVVED